MSAEHAVERVSSNPLNKVKPALERLGITKDGGYYFDISKVQSDSDILVLIRQNGNTALVLYTKPVEAVDTKDGQHYTLVKNQVLVLDEDDELMVFTGDVIRCNNDGNHANGIESTKATDLDVTEQEDFFRLVDRLDTLVDCVRIDELLTQDEVTEHLKTTCTCSFLHT